MKKKNSHSHTFFVMQPNEPTLNASSTTTKNGPFNCRIHNLVEHLTPLVNEPNVTNFLYDLPKGMGLAAKILDALIQPEINSILETGIPINELLKEIDFSKIMSNNNEQLTKSGIQRSDVPRILDGFKAAARAAVPHVKSIMKNFSKIMDLEKEISALNIKGSAFDLLACELF